MAGLVLLLALTSLALVRTFAAVVPESSGPDGSVAPSPPGEPEPAPTEPSFDPPGTPWPGADEPGLPGLPVTGDDGEPTEPGPSPSPERETSRLDELKEVASRELEPGTIEYEVPSLMDVGIVNEVVVRISRDEDEDLSEGLDEPVRESILVGTFMEARLHDPGAVFDIVPVGEARQALLEDHREWLWDVRPLRDGVHRLRLVVTVHHEDTELERTALSRDITVRVGWWQARWAWFKDNYPAIVGGLAIVGAIARFRFGKWLAVLKRRWPRSVQGVPRESGGSDQDETDRQVKSPDKAGT